MKPGCALSAEPISGRNGGDSTFGTVGGYVTIHGTSYAVTVGHLFRTSGSVSNTETFPAGSSVVANPVLVQRMRHYIREGFGDQLDIQHLFATYGTNQSCEKMKKRCPLSQEDMNDTIVSSGTLVGCLLGTPNSEGKFVDVAVIHVDGPAIQFDGNGWKLYTVEEGINILPSLEIRLDEDMNSIDAVLIKQENAIGCKAHGYGAYTSADINVQVNDDYFSLVIDKSKKDDAIRVVRCFKGAVEYGGRTMRPGDSGTWFWCKDSSLLGMGFGTLNNDAMILSMTDVVTAVLDIVHPERCLGNKYSIMHVPHNSSR